MPRHRIDVQIDRSLRCGIRAAWVRRVVARALRASGVAQPAEVDVLLTGDEEVRRLNRQYRRVDGTTDVLSFALDESEAAFPGEPGGPPSLGQVVVSYPRAVAQAREYGHSLEREVAFLIVHGLLHLLNFDHEKPTDEARMTQAQEAILSALGILREPPARS